MVIRNEKTVPCIDRTRDLCLTLESLCHLCDILTITLSDVVNDANYESRAVKRARLLLMRMKEHNVLNQCKKIIEKVRGE